MVSVRSRPNGLPIAIAGSPTCTPLEDPSGSGCSCWPAGVDLQHARGRWTRRCRATLRGRRSACSANCTVIFCAPSTTWALVRIVPLSSITKPEPVACPRCSWGMPKSNGEVLCDCWTIVGADEDDAGRVALVDVARGQALVRGAGVGRAAERAPARRSWWCGHRRGAGPRRAARDAPQPMTADAAATGSRLRFIASEGASGSLTASQRAFRIAKAGARRGSEHFGLDAHARQAAARRLDIVARISVSPMSTASTPTRSSSSIWLARRGSPTRETTVLPAGHVAEQLVGALDVDGEVRQVAVVDADDVGVDDLQRAVELVLVVDLDEHVEVQRARLPVQLGEVARVAARRRSAGARRRRPPPTRTPGRGRR